jgi:hypothetical protein
VYLGLGSLAVGLFLVWFRERKAYDGQVALLYLALHEGAKGLLEFLRGSLTTHSVVHLRVIALSLSAAAVSVLIVRAMGWFTRLLPQRLPPPSG